MVRVKYTDQRRRSRTAALQSLFAADVRGIWNDPQLEWLDEDEALPDSTIDFAQKLLSGVSKNRSGLDNVITRYAPAWPVSQLSVIDRNILRIALFELIYTPGTPRKTAINEAVELAKIFGSESSARFVNGVLGSAMSGLESGEIAPIEPVPEGTVYDRVKTIVVDKLGVDEDEVTESSSFIENLNADSLDLVELIMAFEEEFSTDDTQLEISDEDAANIATVNDAVKYLKDHGVKD